MAGRLLNYKRNLGIQNGSSKKFLLPWGAVIMVDCDEKGNLRKFSTVKEYQNQNEDLWILCRLFLFRNEDTNELFHCYSCSKCEGMKSVGALKLVQSPATIQSMKCVHSKAADFFSPDWDDYSWDMDNIDDRVLSYRVRVHEDIGQVTLCEDEFFLAVTQVKGVITLDRELPVLWRNLIDILHDVEKTEFLPPDL